MKTIRKGLGKGKGSGYYNLIKGYDSYIHTLSAKGVKSFKLNNPFFKGQRVFIEKPLWAERELRTGSSKKILKDLQQTKKTLIEGKGNFKDTSAWIDSLGIVVLELAKRHKIRNSDKALAKLPLQERLEVMEDVEDILFQRGSSGKKQKTTTEERAEAVKTLININILQYKDKQIV
jgi:hypothetical protein